METDPRVVGEASGTFGDASSSPPAPKKSRTNTPWTPAEEQRLKNMRDTGSSWSDIAKVSSATDVIVVNLADTVHFKDISYPH